MFSLVSVFEERRTKKSEWGCCGGKHRQHRVGSEFLKTEGGEREGRGRGEGRGQRGLR